MEPTITMENGSVKLEIEHNGIVKFTNKKTAQVIMNPFFFEETADRGDSYIYCDYPETPLKVDLIGSSVQINEWNEFTKSCTLSKELVCPKDFDFHENKRSTELVACPLTVTFTLQKGSPFLHCEYSLENNASYHRVRFCINTAICSKNSIADIPFDVISSNEDSHYMHTMSHVLPNTSFVAIESQQAGVAVFTTGNHEYEHLYPSALAFTIVRSTGIISRDFQTMKPNGGEHWVCPDNQCLRIMNGKFGIYPYENDFITADIPLLSKQFRNPLFSCYTSFDVTKLSIGRSAVQDTRLSENFYLPDEYPQMKVFDNQSAFTVEGKGIVVTCFKAAEHEEGLILRLINLCEHNTDCQLAIKGNIYRTDMSENEKHLLGTNSITLKLHKKEICTLFIET